MTENTKNKERFKLLPGQSWRERELARQEDQFVTNAANAALTGMGWDAFLREYPAYKHFPNAEHLESEYNRMRSLAERDRIARSPGKYFDMERELEAVRAARRHKYEKEIAELHYQEHRDELLNAAFKRMPWEQVQRTIDNIGPDDRPLYERARKECGTANQADAPDTEADIFTQGFFSD